MAGLVSPALARIVLHIYVPSVLMGFGLGMLLPVYVVSDLGYSASEVGYLFGVVGFVQLLMIVPAGFISDKIGRKAAVVPAALFGASRSSATRSPAGRSGWSPPRSSSASPPAWRPAR